MWVDDGANDGATHNPSWEVYHIKRQMRSNHASSQTLPSGLVRHLRIDEVYEPFLSLSDNVTSQVVCDTADADEEHERDGLCHQ